MPSIRESSYVVAHNLITLKDNKNRKEQKELKEMPWTTHFVSGVYYNQWAGIMVINNNVADNCCQLSNKQDVEGKIMAFYQNRTCGRCKYGTVCSFLLRCTLNRCEQSNFRKSSAKSILTFGLISSINFDPQSGG